MTRVSEPPGEARADLWIFNRLAQRWPQGRAMTFPESAEAVFEEMKALSRGDGADGRPRNLDISGMSYRGLLEQRGLQWPMREGDATGAARLYGDGVFPHPDGRARLIPLPFVDNNEQPGDDYPFWLNSGRVVEHFHTRTKTGKIGNCNKFSPTPYMEMNPDVAAELDIAHMQYVRLVSRRGDAVVMVQLTQRVPRNMVFIPFHFHDCVNRLTLGLLDPHSRQPAFKQCAVRIEHTDQAEAACMNAALRAF